MWKTCWPLSYVTPNLYDIRDGGPSIYGINFRPAYMSNNTSISGWENIDGCNWWIGKMSKGRDYFKVGFGNDGSVPKTKFCLVLTYHIRESGICIIVVWISVPVLTKTQNVSSLFYTVAKEVFELGYIVQPPPI